MIFRNIFRAILKDENTEDFKKEVKGLNISSKNCSSFCKVPVTLQGLEVC